MRKPELKQFGDLVEADFQLHPVWIQCHIVDYDEPWHDETDAASPRPRCLASTSCPVTAWMSSDEVRSLTS